jgi:hypothetical protein
MRIAVLHGSNDVYGASRVLAGDCDALVRAGHEVLVLLPEEGPLTGLLTAAGADVRITDLHVLRLSEPRTLIQPPFSLPGWGVKPDVVVLWTMALAGYLPLLRARRIRTLLSVHELLSSAAGRVLGASAILSSGRIQVNSRATAEWLRRCGVPSRRLDLAYPAAPAHAPLAARTESGTIRLLLAGRLNGTKGHREAVELVERVRLVSGLDVHLRLAGAPWRGQEQHAAALFDRIADLPWATYVGEIPNLREGLVDSDFLLVWPQRPDSFGVTPLEAWAAGRRSIGLPSGGAAEALRMVDGIPVDDSSNEASAASLIWALSAPALAAPPVRQAPVALLATQQQRTASWMRMILDQ